MKKAKIVTRKLPDFYVFKKKIKGIKTTELEDMFYSITIRDFITYWKKYK